MNITSVRNFAMALAEVTEEPHHHFSSFRVAGKIFVTVPPDQAHIHVFVPEEAREQALAMYPEFVEKLLWGGKVVGVRVTLASADAAAVKSMVKAAWHVKAAAAPASKARKSPAPTKPPPHEA
jgi:YjbR